MRYKKKIIYFMVFLLILFLVYFFTPRVVGYFEWQKVAKAVGGFPYQIGLTTIVVTPCFTTGTPPICTGGTLCFTLDPVRCNLYSDVSGVPAGGMGNMALFMKTRLAQSGAHPGGQLIAGGMSPVLMGSGVLASTGGCAGCVVKADDVVDEIKNWFNNFIIAGFRGEE